MRSLRINTDESALGGYDEYCYGESDLGYFPFEKGAITEEEFQEKKAEILGSQG
jgi:hypothetical protein